MYRVIQTTEHVTYAQNSFIELVNDVIKTVETLPRNKNNNGLVWIMYKRQKDKKSYYLSEMVRPEKIYEALRYLKEYHPAYKNINIS